jgi:hypothetical protein
VTLRCWSWNCPECVHNRKDRLIAEGCAGQPNTFLTLTIRRGVCPDENATAKKLAYVWRILRLRIMRGKPQRDAYAERCVNAEREGKETPPRPAAWPFRAGDRPRPLPFIAVIEKHKSGWPHLHILLRYPWIHQQWLSKEMNSLVQSPIQDIRRIDNKGRIAGYVAKYIAEDPHKFGSAKRYWQSRDYDLRPPHQREKRPADGRFELVERTTLATWCHLMLCQGYSISRPSFWVAEATPRFGARAPPTPSRGFP